MARNNQDEQLRENTEKIKKTELKSDFKAFAKNMKVQMLMTTLFFVLGLVIIMAFAQPIFNKDGINFSSLAILVMLCIYGMVAGRMEGIEWSLKREHGLYRYCMNKFDNALNKIKDIKHYFAQYCDYLYIKKRKTKILKILSNYGIDDERVLDLDCSELHELIGKTYKKNWLGDETHKPSRHAEKYKNGDCGEEYVSYFDSYNEEQVEVIRACITGYFEVSKLSESYFLNPELSKSQDAYFGATTSEKQKNKVSMWMMTSRIIMLILSAVLLSSLAWEVYQSTGENDMAVVVQRLMDTGSRIFILVTSIIWGFMIGTEIVKIDTYYVSYRVDVLETFRLEYDQKIFVPKDLKQELKERYNQEEKRREEARMNVIMPDEILENGNIRMIGGAKENE